MMSRFVIACAFSIAAPAAASSESASAPLARHLVETMQQQKLEAIAAVDPADPDRFVAALFSSGQLLVVSARHPEQALLAGELVRQQYRGIYAALHGATIVESKFFVQDLRADGLQNTSDSVDVVYENAVNQTIFDGRPEAHKISKRAYGEKLQQAEERYSHMLRLLIDAARGAAGAIAAH